MQFVPNILFAILLTAGIGFFLKNISKLRSNIKLGKAVERSDNTKERWKNMIKMALGQSKMVNRPVSGILHITVYLGFIIINIEIAEIILDGLLGTHRLFSFATGFYSFLIGTFEILAVIVFFSVSIFWIRRNIIKIKRFCDKEMTSWPKNDANTILYFEMVIMSLFLIMNATDTHFQEMNSGNIISRFLAPFFIPLSAENLHIIERLAWWLHITCILIFLNYLYYSKHLHILLAFPNTFYSNLNPQGQFTNNKTVTKEMQALLSQNYNENITNTDATPPDKFGASDVTDLNWVQLMNAYTCTECGRCTSVCPASQTGKKLSPRAIMMKTRDRLEEISKNINANKGIFKNDKKQLLNDYISPEEIWACTSCNACVEECPINIDPLSIIMDMRQYLVMEQSAAPQDLNTMMTNIENNSAPWACNKMDRLNWKD